MDQEHKLNGRRKRRKSAEVRRSCFRFLTLKEVNCPVLLCGLCQHGWGPADPGELGMRPEEMIGQRFSFLLFVTENNLTNTSTDGQNCSCHCGRHNATTIKNVNELCYQGVLILGIYAKDSLHDSKVLYVEKLISTLDFSLGATNQLLHQET